MPVPAGPPPSSILLWHAAELHDPPTAPCCLRTTRAGSRAAVYRTGSGAGVAGFFDFTSDAEARPEGGWAAEGMAYLLDRPVTRPDLLADDVLGPVFRHLRGRRVLPASAAARLDRLVGGAAARPAAPNGAAPP